MNFNQTHKTKSGETDIAVVIPCYNEEASIGEVVSDFKKHLPSAQIYVCDNNSQDRTSEIAKQHGAAVLFELELGKANAVRRLFQSVDAEIFVMVDGDGTYPASKARDLIETLRDTSSDMVIGVRKSKSADAYRFGHVMGNKFFTFVINLMFKGSINDVFSGYRVFNKRFVMSFNPSSTHFAIEAEMNVHALLLGLAIAEEEVEYGERPKGSQSKLSALKDGTRILVFIFYLFIFFMPIKFFGLAALICASVSMYKFSEVYQLYIATGVVDKIPTLIVSSAFGITALVSLFSGFVDTCYSEI